MPPKRKANQKPPNAPRKKKAAKSKISSTERPQQGVQTGDPIKNNAGDSSGNSAVNSQADIVSAVVEELIRRGVVPRGQDGEDKTTTSSQTGQSVAENEVEADEVAEVFGGPSTSAEIPAGVPAVGVMGSYEMKPGALVSDKLKNQIWREQFIEMADLLPRSNQQQEQTVTIQLSSGQDMCIKPNKTGQRNLSINQWLTAFHIFMDIYTEKYPHQMSGLLAYCNLIRDLERARGAAAFNFYDRTFRAHRQTVPLPWAIMHTELYVKATTMFTPMPDRQTGSSEKPVVCHNYNKQKGCSFQHCKYPHVCSHCGKKGHPRQKCFRLNKPVQAAAPSSASPSSSFQQGRRNQPLFQQANANASHR